MPKDPREKYELVPRFEQLQNFLDTIKYGGSSAAAKARKIKNKAYIAQSNNRLQNDIGVLLFHPRTSDLTPAGERFAYHAKRMMAARKRMLREMNKMSAANRLRRVVHLVAPIWLLQDLNIHQTLLEKHNELYYGRITTCQNDFQAWFHYSKLISRRQEAVLLTTDLAKGFSGKSELLTQIPLKVAACCECGQSYIGYDEYGHTQSKLGTLEGQWRFVSTPTEVLFAAISGVGIGFLPEFYMRSVNADWVVPENLKDFSESMDIFYIP